MNSMDKPHNFDKMDNGSKANLKSPVLYGSTINNVRLRLYHDSSMDVFHQEIVQCCCRMDLTVRKLLTHLGER